VNAPGTVLPVAAAAAACHWQGQPCLAASQAHATGHSWALLTQRSGPPQQHAHRYARRLAAAWQVQLQQHMHCWWPSECKGSHAEACGSRQQPSRAGTRGAQQQHHLSWHAPPHHCIDNTAAIIIISCPSVGTGDTDTLTVEQSKPLTAAVA
jgi:hypothetical protein